MKQGIVGAFLNAPRVTKNAVAVLEVDEGSLKNVVEELQPKLFVHTNIFADQLDRYGSIDNIYKLLTDAADTVPDATVLANGDLPLFNSVEMKNPQKFFGFKVGVDKVDADNSTSHCSVCGHKSDRCHVVL